MAHSKSNRFICNYYNSGDIEGRDYPGDDCSEDDTSENEYVQWRRRRHRMHRITSIINNKDHLNPAAPLDVTELYRHNKHSVKVPKVPGYHQLRKDNGNLVEARVRRGPTVKQDEIYAPTYNNCACNHLRRTKKFIHPSKPETIKYYDELPEEVELSDPEVPYEGDYLLYHSNPQISSPCNSTIALRRFATISNGPILTRFPKSATVSRRVPIMPPSNQPRAYRRIPTVPTPRYYRKQPIPVGNNSLYKRPSKLCLPLVCQPDYGSFYHRKHRSNVVPGQVHRKNPVHKVMQREIYDTPYYTEEYVAFCPEHRHHTKRIHQAKCGQQEIENYKLVNDDENENTTTSDMDALLTRYESVLNAPPPTKIKPSASRQTCIKKKSRIKLNSAVPELLKPRVPASIKLKQEAAKKLETRKKSKGESVTSRENETNTKENNPGVLRLNGTVTTEELDKLLDDLMTNKMAPKTNDSLVDKVKTNDKTEKNHETGDFNKENPKQKAVGDLQTFRESLQKAQLARNEDNVSMSTANNRPETTEKSSNVESGSFQAERTKPSVTNTVGKIDQITYCEPSVEDTRVALELHRSKSYIINLIDRALSKELGTLTESQPKKTSKNRESSTTTTCPSGSQQTNPIPNNGIYVNNNRIYPELTTPFFNPVFKPRKNEERKSPPVVFFPNGTSEDTAYISHLRQLRWGHLQHIQHEIQRLEDLERFLDKCSSSNQFYEYLSSASNTK